MNQEKIGKFILSIRKDMNMTQLELAEKLGVSDRTISKWENGRGMPDWSLIKPLCNALNVTINELLSGERITKNDLEEKSELNILNTITYTEKKVNKTKRTFRLIISIFVFVIFWIDIKRMNNNEPVFFSTWGFKYHPSIDLHEEEISLAIENYLINKLDNEFKHHENEKGFVSFRTYLIEEKDNLYNIYSFVLEEKYYEVNEIKKDSGSFIPYKFVVKLEDDNYIVIDSRIPRDGSLYEKDMKNIFPKSVLNDMENAYYDGTIERLSLDIQKQVNLYFHK